MNIAEVGKVLNDIRNQVQIIKEKANIENVIDLDIRKENSKAVLKIQPNRPLIQNIFCERLTRYT